MVRKAWLLMLLTVMMISLGIFTLKGFGKEQNPGKRHDTKIVSEKIDEVLKNQQDIIAQLKDIRKELDIIRVRASQR